MLDQRADVNGPREIGRLVHRPIHLVLRSADEQLPSTSWFKATRRSSSKMGLQILKRLLDLGADPNCTDGNVDTPLTYACRLPFEVDGREVIKILLNHGLMSTASPTAVVHSKLSPKALFSSAARFQVIATIEVSGKLDLDARDLQGMTALIRLASLRLHKRPKGSCFLDNVPMRKRMMVMLLRNGADVHTKQLGNTENSLCAGGTALHFACYNCDPAMLKLLIDNGAAKDVSSFTKAGFTVLMILVTAAIDKVMSGSELECVKQLLLEAVADPFIKNAAGKTAWDIWVEKRPVSSYWVLEPVIKDFEVLDDDVKENLST
ncbi:ankyrin repeat-containing domain protein [Ilyonectria destructans]|nr:ankyrin repeat-containing domain protein [Ilyonectria destructans]